MQEMADIALQKNSFMVTGDLRFSNVMSVYEKSLPLTAAHPELIFDFSQLKSSDSSGLALIIEWIKLAKRDGKTWQIKHLSSDLLSIAKVAGIDELISG